MNIADKLQIINQCRARMTERYFSLGTTIAQLTALGCIDAAEYWKDGKYLYLVSSMRNGRRKKRYIGNHPLRIKEAREKVENHKKREGCIITQSKIEAELAEIDRVVGELVKVCARYDLTARFAAIDDGNGDSFLLSGPGSTAGVSPIIGVENYG
jgi:hypothetical protein